MSTNREIVKLFWHHAWRYPHFVIGLAIAVPVNQLLRYFIPPLIAANILDRLSNGNYIHGDIWASFGNDLLLYAGLIAFTGIIGWRIIIQLIWRLEGYVQRDIYQEMFKHLMNLSANFHANSFGGSLVSQTNKLASAYVRIADTTVFQAFGLLVSFVFTIIILAPKAPLYVILLTILSAIYILSAIFATKNIRELNAGEAKAQNKQTGVLADMITNIMAVKSFATSFQEEKRFAKATEATRAKTMALMRASTVKDAYFGLVSSIIDISALVVAIASVVIFDANIALVFLVLSYTNNIVDRLWEFGQNTLRQYNRALGDAQDGIKTLLTEPEVKDIHDPLKAIIPRGRIVFDKVKFAHDGAKDQLLFKNLSLSIKPGEKVGFVGHSGSGKTTFTRLLLRYSDIQSGTISIDGQDVSQLAQNDLRSHIAYVPQEPLLFHRTISENIRYGKPEANEQEVIAVAKMANAHEFVKNLPRGYDTLVGERGVKLSGGQRQRIAIARAMIKNAPILVLDEATSALDSESEVLIQDALWKLMEGRTTIVIAHRLSTIQRMDRIIVLDNGKIVEQGTHKELVNKPKGVYASLWEHQSGGFLEE
jgi:ATP-binding cassette subfamily B protein